ADRRGRRPGPGDPLPALHSGPGARHAGALGAVRRGPGGALVRGARAAAGAPARGRAAGSGDAEQRVSPGRSQRAVPGAHQPDPQRRSRVARDQTAGGGDAGADGRAAAPRGRGPGRGDSGGAPRAHLRARIHHARVRLRLGHRAHRGQPDHPGDVRRRGGSPLDGGAGGHVHRESADPTATDPEKAVSPHPFDPLSLRERGNSARRSFPLSRRERGTGGEDYGTGAEDGCLVNTARHAWSSAATVKWSASITLSANAWPGTRPASGAKGRGVKMTSGSPSSSVPVMNSGAVPALYTPELKNRPLFSSNPRTP